MKTPFEKNYHLLHVFYSKRLRWGLYLRVRAKDWLRIFWSHPEADVIWYGIGPLAFYTG